MARNKIHCFLAGFVCGFLVVLFALGSPRARANTGTIFDTVDDATGTIVPETKVAAVNDAPDLPTMIEALSTLTHRLYRPTFTGLVPVLRCGRRGARTEKSL